MKRRGYLPAAYEVLKTLRFKCSNRFPKIRVVSNLLRRTIRANASQSAYRRNKQIFDIDSRSRERSETRYRSAEIARSKILSGPDNVASTMHSLSKFFLAARCGEENPDRRSSGNAYVAIPKNISDIFVVHLTSRSQQYFLLYSKNDYAHIILLKIIPLDITHYK